MPGEREKVTGPEDGPASPFPIKVNGRIVRGFGRGSRELGIPTANIPIDGLEVGGHKDVMSGVYYGWAGLSFKQSIADAALAQGPTGGKDEARHSSQPAPLEPSTMPDKTYPMVMSIGWNPFYDNKVRSVEVHVIHKFDSDFYNAKMNLAILGFIRPEQNYDSMQSLIDDINFDTEVAKTSLARAAYAKYAEDAYLQDFSWDSSHGS
ncbi:MAG: riboflavin kinase [Chrysothrix sp. TS-e1954]|nr:MAG: riboflavin kinase [Chrysothrix sp. TS-e1954]